MVVVKNRFRGVKQNLKKARVYWNVKIWDKFSRKNRIKFYSLRNKKKYNAINVKKIPKSERRE
jgi:hypothetical protein